MRTRTNLIVDVLALSVYLLAANPAATGIAVHEWVSLGLALVAAVHLALHGDWVIRTVRRFAGRLANASRFSLVVASLTGASLASVTVSGLAVSLTLAGLIGVTSASGPAWRAAHAASAVAVALVGLLHLALHWRWALTALRLHVVAPIARTFTGAPEAKPAARVVAWALPTLLATGLLALTVLGFTGPGTLATTANAAASSTGTLTCPRNGCTAATCHATTGGAPGASAAGTGRHGPRS